MRFRWGALSGVPPRYSACPARPLYGWARSKYSPNCLDIAVVLWPCNLTTYVGVGCQAGDVPGPGVARRDTLWGSPLVGPATPVGSGAIVSPLPTSRVPPIPEGFRTKLKRRPWPICQRERRTSSAKNSKE